MSLDKTTIRHDPESGEYIVERNHACKSIGLREPLVNVDPNMSIEPGICYDTEGKPILTDSGEMPVLMPRTLHIPDDKPFDKVLEYAEGMRKKQETCPACKRVGEKIRNGEVDLPPKIKQEVEEEHRRILDRFPMLQNLRPGIFPVFRDE